MADIALRESPVLAKAYGARQALAESFALPGEAVALAVKSQKRTIKAQGRLIKSARRADKTSQKALVMFKRAMDADKLALSKVEQYALPSESEISQRVSGMLQRRMAVDRVDFTLARIDTTLAALN